MAYSQSTLFVTLPLPFH